MQPLLNHLHSLYGSNVCGEGGEYETLTLDCLLFKNCKIVLDDYDILLHSLDNIAPVGVLHPSKFHLECKAPDMASEVNQVPLVKEVDNSMENCTMQQQNSGGCNPVSIKQLQSIDKLNIHISLRILKGSVSSVCCWIRSCPDTYGIGNELGLVLASISAELEIIDLSWANALYVHLYVHDMGAFALANETYVQYITEELCVKGVPSRSTVGLALKDSNLGRVMVEVLIAKDMNKKVLHVQSISCWAPSCIGPYSQATLHNGFLYMAGQLGLDPPTMALVNGGAGSEFKQALQNSEAIAQAFSTSLSTSPISILLYCSPIVGMSEREETETILHNFLRQYDQGADLLSYVPVLYVQVSALPKGANVEIEPFLYVPDQSGSCDYEGILLQRVSSSAKACQASIVRECLCRAFFSIAKNISGHTAEALPDIKTGLRTSLQDFSQMLVNTGLCWEHVLALRILFVADLISMEFLFEGWQHAVMQFCEISVQEAVPLSNMSALCSLKPLFLPVLGTGLTPSMEDVITLDLLAVSQPPNH